jgi:predicted DNA-binding transcriptional regulator AlpA
MQMFTISKASEITGLSPSSLYNRWRENTGPRRTRIGRRVLISEDALREWLNAQQEAA